MRLVQTVALGSVFLMATPAFAQELNLDAGTMQLGGATSFIIDMNMPDVGDSVTGMTLSIVPTFGYFIMDNLELNVDVSLGIFMGDLYDGYPTLLGFGVGGRYFIPMGGFVPYAGLRIGMGFLIPSEGDTAKALALALPLGVLLPLNEHVAIDAGIRIVYNMSLEDGGMASLSIPIGYFGVQAYF